MRKLVRGFLASIGSLPSADAGGMMTAANRISGIEFHSVRRALLTLVLALALAIPLASRPAQAGIKDCVDAISTAKDIGEKAALVAACAGHATGDPVLAVVATVMIALAIHGDVKGSDDCEAKINGLAGALIGEALQAAGINSDEINKLVSGELSLSDIPALQGLIGCACAIAGAKDDAAKLVKQEIQNLKACAAVFTEVAEAAGDAIESGLDGVAEGLGLVHDYPTADKCCVLGGSLSQDGHVYMTLSCASKLPSAHADQPVCKTGWLNGKYSTSDYKTHQKATNGQMCSASGPCYCPQGTTVETKGDQVRCKCPNNQSYQNGQCKACPANAVLLDDGYTCQVCDVTQKPDMSKHACVPRCVTGQIWDYNAGKCTSCKAGTYAVLTGSNSSAGICKACDIGKTSKPGQSSASACYRICDNKSAYVETTKKCVACPVHSELQSSGGAYAEYCECNTGYKNTSNVKCEALCKPGEAWVNQQTVTDPISKLPKSVAIEGHCESCASGIWDFAKNTCDLNITKPDTKKLVCKPGDIWVGQKTVTDPISKIPKSVKIEGQCEPCASGIWNFAKNECSKTLRKPDAERPGGDSGVVRPGGGDRRTTVGPGLRPNARPGSGPIMRQPGRR